MKKTLITLLALGGLAMGTEETPATPATPATPDWTITDHGDGTATYSITLNGSYYINLGDAAISDGESFSMSVETTASRWGNDWGTGLVGTSNPYAANGTKGDDEFIVYIGRADKNEKLIYALNNWNYTKSDIGTGEGKVDYTNAANSPSEEAPLTLGVTFTFVNADDAEDDNDYFVIESTDNSDVAFSFRDDNIVRSFNFSTLINYGGTSGAGAENLVRLPDNAVTTISITKAVPEPTTATLSLLALAGLAARRRRR